MMRLHLNYWPSRMPTSLSVPETTLYDNLEVTARRYPNKMAVMYYGARLSYQKLLQDVDRMAAYLHLAGVRKQDRILLYMQNSPQFIIAYYAILRAGAVVVPVNPMNLTEELSHYIQDGAVKLGFVGQELFERIAPLIGSSSLEQVINATYSDYSGDATEASDVVKAPRMSVPSPAAIEWMKALTEVDDPPQLPITHADDLAVLSYTSGTTGKPKGCMHTHRTIQANVVSTTVWGAMTPDVVSLTTLPLFHVTGMVHSMHAPVYTGAAMVVMTRWDRNTAAALIQQHKCTHWTNISTMVVDFLANPRLGEFDTSSLQVIDGGGAPLPAAVGEKLYQTTGLRYVEGYGLSETMSQTHFNPIDRPKLQCMGIPAFDVDARIIDPETLEEKGVREEGEVVINGPQVFKGYWQRPEENENAFLNIDGKMFFRTGDIAYYDEEGYFFMVDRVKRMINASGLKVWPSEVESILYRHPAIEQACVVGVPDERKGEEIKAYVVLQENQRGLISEEEIIRWSQLQMAAYKYPRIIEFVESLPVSGSGKILWRKLQELEQSKTAKS
ncbi:long-chain fatty acid--CoA ligase [Aneurinibacillus sp. Ricciae_BoGa-3]|uniref:long-chain fatty acid--CoA ligase n=1 Tax=Aneurinibacillus sp. Ricciae_BoGa-3 TaxID=3022697 RepID=UPI00233F7CE4|nr:long-chain fatty acid--CoA ligase [Aneurinibacillus sp. Ricciae_BoGa-3]WCK56370.1 long-chain fatty acid--CoA ligase [Aneurinibacillus sp. Ricciae_BoGa-3]